MINFGICFKLRSANAPPLFLFPSLSSTKGKLISFILLPTDILLFNTLLAPLLFSIEADPRFQYSGIRANAPFDTIFLPGFLCQLIVEILSLLNVSLCTLLQL